MARRRLRVLVLAASLGAGGWLFANEPADSATVCGYARVITAPTTVNAPLTGCSPTPTSCPAFSVDTDPQNVNDPKVTVQAYVCVRPFG